ncbi:MAG: glycosyltransferase, partial [Eubacteriales bacterium]|nr:glycosyltransferase [Eubacteriales bacterium]
GSKVINDTARKLLPKLLPDYQIIHLCGKGNLDTSLNGTKGYVQYEYANEELADMFALADLVISRAGANSICELLALHKPNILIPLSRSASRGDQILNANSFKNQGFSYVIEEEELSEKTLLNAVKEVWEKKDTYISAMKSSQQMDAVTTITNLIEELRKQ